MRILWVKAGKILPVDTGGKIRSFNLLKHLAARNELTLLSYYDGPEEKAYEEDLVQKVPAVTINTGRSESVVGQTINYLKSLHRSAPFAVTKFTSSKVRDLINKWDKEKRFDVIVCDFLSASLHFNPQALQTPIVLFQHNVESALWQRQATHETSLLKRMAFKVEARKMTRYEQSAVRTFRHVIAVSEHDRSLMSQMTDASRISVVPTGVDLAEFSQSITTPSANGHRDVLFLGSMDWEANIDGVDFFCSDIWPHVKQAVPNARFYIVGRNPPERIADRASESIVVTGRVASVLPYLQQASVFVVPLRIGGGTRLKIYEAMAAGKAVVSTSVGAEGLDVHHNEDILLADDPQAFAQSVIHLLEDEGKRMYLSQNAAHLASKYDWQKISEQFEEILLMAAKKERGV